jgi:hypothetical protein
VVIDTVAPSRSYTPRGNVSYTLWGIQRTRRSAGWSEAVASGWLAVRGGRATTRPGGFGQASFMNMRWTSSSG